MAHLQTSLNIAYFWGEQPCARLPFWVRRRQERESKPSRAFSAQNNSVIMKQNKTALKLHSWWTLWLSSPLKKKNRPSSLTELRPKIFTPCVGGGQKPGVTTPSQNPKDIFFPETNMFPKCIKCRGLWINDIWNFTFRNRHGLKVDVLASQELSVMFTKASTCH